MNDKPPLYKVEEKILANKPSWYAAGITAGLAVLILANVKPFAVPKVDCDNKLFDCDVAVLVSRLLSE